MKQVNIPSCGVQCRVSVPESVEEFDTLAKRTGACLDEAINNVIYRGVLADFRDALVTAVIGKTGIARTSEPEKNGKKKEDGSPVMVFTESEGKYLDRAVSASGLSEADFQAIADEVCGSVDASGQPVITFDPSERERKTREASVGKQDLEMALAFLTGDESKLKKVLKNISKIGEMDITLTGDQAVDQRAIALGIKAVRNNTAKLLGA